MKLRNILSAMLVASGYMSCLYVAATTLDLTVWELWCKKWFILIPSLLAIILGSWGIWHEEE